VHVAEQGEGGIQRGFCKRRGACLGGLAGKLAMADVFLIALYIVLAKGVGVGTVETGWGLYLFTFCVLLSLLITEITKRQLKDH